MRFHGELDGRSSAKPGAAGLDRGNLSYPPWRAALGRSEIAKRWLITAGRGCRVDWQLVTTSQPAETDEKVHV